MKHKFKKTKLNITLAISFFTVLLIPIVLTSMVFWRYDKKFSDYNSAFYKQILDTTTSNVSNVLYDIRKISMDISYNTNLSSILSINDFDSYFHDENLYLVLEDFAFYGRYRQYQYLYYIYISKTDAVLSARGVQTSRDFFDVNFKHTNISYEEWLRMLTPKSSIDFYNIISSDTPNHETINYVTPLLQKNYDDSASSATLIISTDKQNLFLKSSSEIDWINMCNTYIFDTNNNLVTSQVNSLDSATPANEIRDLLQDTKHQVVVSNISFDTTNWKVITVIPNEVYNADLLYMRSFFAAALILCLIISLYTIKRMVSKNYQPVMQLLSIVGKSAHWDEFNVLQKSIIGILAENEQLSKNADKQRIALKNSVLNRLLTGTMQHQNLSLIDFDIYFNHKYFLIVMFEVSNIEELFMSDESITNEQRFLLTQFILENVFTELLSNNENKAYMTEIDNFFACIVNVKQNSPDILGKIKDSVKHGGQFIIDNFNIDTVFGISNIHYDLTGIATAYNEALSTLEYIQMLDANDVCMFNQLNTITENSYYLSLENEQKIINCIKNGDYQTPQSIIDALLESIQKNKSISIDDAHNVMYSIISLILKIPYEIPVKNSQRLVETLNTGRLYASCTNLKEFRGQLSEVFENLYDYILVDKSSDDIFVDKIIEYINETYSDVNLSISAIGNYLNLSPSYVSKLFKDKTGNFLINYINAYRLNKAKELIKNSNIPLNKISEQVGYSSIRTFNRIFKKYEGMTPSAYKSMF